VQFEQLEEPAIPVTKKIRNYALKLERDNQKIKAHCYPPPAEDEPSFVKHFYRLKGFAYLRSNQVGEVEGDNLIKAAKAFKKAIGATMKDQNELKQVIEGIRKKQHFKDAFTDVMEAKSVNRATFNNFRKKLEGEMIDADTLEEEALDQPIEIPTIDAETVDNTENQYNA
jgi:hypothetical protein